MAAVLAFRHDWPSPLAVGVGIGAGAVIGLVQGLIVTRVAVPSFVVTLAGLLVWQGATLAMLGRPGTVNIPPEDWMARLSGARLGTGPVLALVAVGAGLFAVDQLRARQRRSRAGLEPGPWPAPAGRLVVVVAGIAVGLADRRAAGRCPGVAPDRRRRDHRAARRCSAGPASAGTSRRWATIGWRPAGPVCRPPGYGSPPSSSARHWLPPAGFWPPPDSCP